MQSANQLGSVRLGGFMAVIVWFKVLVFDPKTDPPPLKWSDLRYVSDIQEDCNGKEAIQA
jgi:hypothetical protein